MLLPVDHFCQHFFQLAETWPLDSLSGPTHQHQLVYFIRTVLGKESSTNLHVQVVAPSEEAI